MATSFTGSQIKDTYAQILHVDGGPAAAEKPIYSAVGVATAVKIGTGSASVDNIRLDGNTISTLDTNGNLTLTPNGTGSVSMAKVAITGGTILGITNLVITGGTITGITDLSIADGGTGASDAAGARTALGLGTIATQAATSVAITGGAVDGATVGATVQAAVQGTTVQATISMGYPAGTGGTVTQLTSKSTGVTLDKISGQITMHNAALNRQTGVSFTLTNSTIAATDVIIINIASGATTSIYTATINAVAAGSCSVHLHNHAPATDLSEAVVLNFAVIKGAHI